MKNNLKVSAVAIIMALLLAIAAAPLLAESGSSDDDSKSSDSSSDKSSSDSASKSSGNADDKAAANEEKVEVKIKENAKTAEVRVKNANSEVRIKADANTGFAGVFSRLMSFLFGKNKDAEQLAANVQKANDNEQAEDAAQKAIDAAAMKETVSTPAPGITIDKSLSSGPGYPTGPLDISLQSATLLLDRVGQVKGNEVKDRQYEVEFTAIPVTINGVSYTATEVKVISNLKTKAGAGQHSGTIDVDIDVPLGSTLPAGHIALEYKGSAIVSGSMITSGGVFKTSKMTGVFSGLVSEGTYTMSIIETGSTFGSPAIVSITTTSNI